MDTYKAQVEQSVSFLQDRITAPPEIIMVLGSGLGSLTNKVEAEQVIPYEDIPHFPKSTVTSHHGNLVYGRLAGRRVAVLQGRFHYYEGYSCRELTLPVRALALLGAGKLLITNAAGGLNPAFSPGTIMVIEDHLNFIGDNPLRGANIDEWGPRFPDMSAAYDRDLIEKTMNCATRLAIPKATSGVYVAIPGPSLETPAETRFLRNCGADAVGMSTVPEVIVARHAGLKVLGLSLVANINNPDDFQPILMDEVIANVEAAAPHLEQLIVETVKDM